MSKPKPIIHQCPKIGSGGIMPCCGKTPFEVRGTKDRITLNPSKVTCGNKGPWK